MDRDRRATLYALVAVLVLIVFAVTSLYAYRSQSPGQVGFSFIALLASALLSLLPVALLVLLVVVLARALYAGRGADRYEQLARVADLRDRGVLGEDEFQREKRRILG